MVSAPVADARARFRFGAALLVAVAQAAASNAPALAKFAAENCAYVVVGAEHINGTPVKVVINENLAIPQELCEGKLHVAVDFEETSGMVHVRYFSTHTGEPVGDQIMFHLPK